MYTLHLNERAGYGNRTRKIGPIEAYFNAFHTADERARAIQTSGRPAWVRKDDGVKVTWHYQMDGKIRRNGKIVA